MGCNSSKGHPGTGTKTLLASTGSSHKGGRGDASGRHGEDKPVTKVISEAQIMQYTPTEEEEEEEEKPRASRSKQRKVTPWCVAGSGALSLDDDEDDEEEAMPPQVPAKAPEAEETGSEPLQRKVKRKATPWTKAAPDAEDEDEEISEQEAARPIAPAQVEVLAARQMKQNGGLCLFNCCLGPDPQPEVVFMQEKHAV